MASVDILPQAPSYLLHSSPASVSTSSLPSFTSELRLDEESLQFQPSDNDVPNQHDYAYSSKTMVLNLGRRIHGASLPTYGANSEIRGTITLKDIKNVKQIVFKISGQVSYLVLEDGFSAYTQCKTVLQHSQNLLSPASSATSSLPISFHIPTYAHQSKSHLPPSIRNNLLSDPATRLNIRLNVTYRIEVELKRHGLYRHERVRTEWWHAPRTFVVPSRPRRPLVPEPAAWESDVKTEPRRSDEVEWRAVRIGSATSGFSLELSIPRRFIYALGESVPFQILLFPFAASASVPRQSDIISRLSFHLVKRVSFGLGYTTSDVSRYIAEAKITEMLTAEDGSCIVSGSVEVPSAEEPSWHIASFLEISYSFDLAFVPSSNHKTYEAEVPVRLVSDEESTLQIEGEEAWTRPAKGTLQALEFSSQSDRHRLLLPATLARVFKSIL